MKKLLLFSITFLFIFTLSACGEEVPTIVDFDTLETTVGDIDTAITGIDTAMAANAAAISSLEDDLSDLETQLSGLQTDLTALEGQSDAADLLITGIQTNITTIEAAIDVVEAAIVTLQAADTAMATDITALGTDVTAINALVAAMQVQIADLEAITDLLVNPLPVIIAPNAVTEIVIAHTNDVHGRVNDDSWAGTIGMASIKNIMDALKAQHSNTYLIAAGDMFHGTTFATLEEGASMVEVMNQVGYDLMVPGNHDFNYGQDRLLELEDMADFPLITANVQYAADDTDFMNPYVIQEFDGVRVGFFGITTPETTYKTHPDNVIGLNFLDPITQATAMVAELEGMVDVIILVAHVGLDTNTEITTEDIATAVPGIDVIIDGHSHTVLPDGMMVGDTLIVSAGEYMNNLGVFTLTVEAGMVTGYDVLLIDADMIEELNYGYDMQVQEFIDEIEDAQDVILSEVVGQTAVELVGVRGFVRTGETNLGNIIADSMMIVTDADVAITNGGGIRSSIEAGDVTLGDIITVLPFGNIIVTIELTGQEIIDSLEHGTSAYPDAEGMFPHVGGMTFDINVNAAEGSRIENLMIDGVAVDLTATYLVATNDFMAAGGDGYTIFATKERVGEFKGLHEALTDMFTVGVDIAMPTMGRVNPTGYTVAEALAIADDEVIVVQGVISGFNGNSNVVIQDADGTAIVVYDYGIVDDNDFELGDKILVMGTRDTYWSLNEIADPTILKVISTGNAVTEFTDVTVADFTADMAAYQGFNVVLTGLIVVELDDTHGYMTLKDALDNEIIFKSSHIPYSTTLWAVDDVVDLSVIVYDVYFGANRVIIYDYPMLSDADAVEYVSTVFEVTDSTMDNIDFIATDGMFDVAFAWSSSNAAVINEYGVVSQPVFGEADAVVTLTVVFTKGVETTTVTYDVTVPAVAAAYVAVGTELFFSEYIEGSSNNKALEIFNPTGAAITMDGYKVQVYSNGSESAGNTLDLAGKVIEAGGVYVIYNASAIVAIKSVGDESATVTYFNGDDTVVLVKNDVVIDIIGEIGQDGADGSSWPAGDGTTSNHTIVRNPNVFGPNATYTSTEWTSYDSDTTDYLGDHVTD